jgi:membrane associated rhomboid family serine protease
MSWSDKLERRFSFLAVPGLLRYIAALTALVFILYKINPAYLALIDLNVEAIRAGEWWRLISYIFIPSLGSLIPAPDWFNAAFSVLFLIWAGDRLEEAWGALRLTLFVLVGMIGTTIAAFFFGAAFSNTMLIMSIFFAFARFYPDVVILFAYIVPMKVKWIAWGFAAYLSWKFLLGSMQYRAALIATLVNYFIFFGRDLFHQARQHREVSVRRQRFESEARSIASEPLHKCKTCGATEATDSNLEFRVASDGEEYCLEHLPSRTENGAPAVGP